MLLLVYVGLVDFINMIELYFGRNLVWKYVVFSVFKFEIDLDSYSFFDQILFWYKVLEMVVSIVVMVIIYYKIVFLWYNLFIYVIVWVIICYVINV